MTEAGHVVLERARASGAAHQRVSPRLDDNFTADLRPTTLLAAADRCLLHAPLGDAVRGPGGAVSAGALLSLVDISTCQPAMLACSPDWTATQDMSVHGAAPWGAGPLVIDARLARVGKHVVVVTADLHDGAGTHDLVRLQQALDRGELARTGRAVATFARLPRTAARASDADSHRPADWVGQVRPQPGGRRGALSLAERLGVVVLDEARGELALPLSAYAANSIGTVLGGAQATLAQLAAEAALPGRVVVDLQVHFLRQLQGTGARTRTSLLREGPAGAVVEVELLDDVPGERLLTRAVATLR